MTYYRAIFFNNTIFTIDIRFKILLQSNIKCTIRCKISDLDIKSK